MREVVPGAADAGESRGVVARLLEVRAGRAVAFGPHCEPSAIHKQPLQGRARVATLGLVDDEQAGSRKHHGGPDKALHHYPREHYAA